MKLWKKVAIATIAGAAAVALFTGCGNTENKPAPAASSASAKTYVVATRGTAKPFNYVDDKGKLTGYEVEVLKEIEKRDPTIKFEFKEMSIAAGFVAMDAGDVDLIANQIHYTEARGAKYLYNKEVINYSPRGLVVKKDRNDIQKLTDLEGKKLAFTPNSGTRPIVDKLNETASSKIEAIYTEKGAVDVLNLVLTDRADAGSVLVNSAEAMIKDNQWPLKILDETLSVTPIYFIFKKDEEHQELADKIDKALQSMKQDGTLKKLSEQYLGGDYTVKPNNKG